ncbi:deoxyribose-phosphate aldolase [bacterium]|nr:deoxyribose-phosphate aldolase [bacterium]
MKQNLAPYIDQTLLKVDTTQSLVEELCTKSAEAEMAGVCIPPFFTNSAKKILKPTQTKLVTVVGFPFGYTNITSKAEATKKVIQDGADEVDMVMNIGAFLGENYAHVADEIESVLTLCHMNNRLLKVIIETCLLSEAQIVKACEICAEKEVDFVKTSTGFNGPGATVEGIKLMRQVLPSSIKIKASGGIKDYDTAMKMIEAGADRIGTSSGFQILDL